MIANRVIGGNGGETASILVTGLSETDTVTATKDGKTYSGKWVSKPNPAYVVPDGYTQLDYIESTGTQYIDTGVLPNQSTNVELDCAYTGAASTLWYPLFGVHDSNNKYYFSFENTNENGLSLGFGTQEFYPVGTHSSERRTISIQDRSLLIDGASVKTANSETFSTVNSMYLFALNKKGTVDSRITSMRCYSFSVERDGSLVRHFIPSKRNSYNDIGMYDLVTNTFFANSGTGTFVAGAEVPQTIDGFLIDSIKSYGTYTITATDGTNTATQDVLVDVATQYDVNISFSKLLTISDFTDAKKISRTNTFTYTMLTNQVDGTDGIRIVGRSSESGSSVWYYIASLGTVIIPVNVTNYSSLTFYARKVVNHGNIQVRASVNEITTSTLIDSTDEIVDLRYAITDTEWHKYTFDLSSYTGILYFAFCGGYADATGSTSSATEYCNVIFQ